MSFDVSVSFVGLVFSLFCNVFPKETWRTFPVYILKRVHFAHLVKAYSDMRTLLVSY